MAAVATVLGGIAGYLMAMIAYFLFGSSLTIALAVWTFGGIAVLAFMLAQRRAPTTDHNQIAAHA